MDEKKNLKKLSRLAGEGLWSRNDLTDTDINKFGKHHYLED